MNWTLIVSLLRLLPWTVLGPIMITLALGLCIRERVHANARADAYARVAEMTAKYSQQQERERLVLKQQNEDSIAAAKARATAYKAQAQHATDVSRRQAATLREQLQGEQRVLLDSLEYNHAVAIAKLDSTVAAKDEIIGKQAEELVSDEQRIAGLTRENDVLKAAVRVSNSSGSTGWKLATAVSTVIGVVAYATK